MAKVGSFTIELSNDVKYLWQYEERSVNIYHVLRPLFKTVKRYWDFETPYKITDPINIELHGKTKLIIEDIKFQKGRLHFYTTSIFIDTNFLSEISSRDVVSKLNLTKSNIDFSEIFTNDLDNIDNELDKMVIVLQKMSNLIQENDPENSNDLLKRLENNKYVKKHVLSNVN
tara:strand:- start:21286 stop:21801 length:516 start_codon:yes stop_codon:yes gene_type:complete